MNHVGKTDGNGKTVGGVLIEMWNGISIRGDTLCLDKPTDMI